ncbi:MAG: M23 family metallopeptidase [bacterium]
MSIPLVVASFVATTLVLPLTASASVFSVLGARSVQADTEGIDSNVPLSPQSMSVVSASNIGPNTLSMGSSKAVDTSTLVNDNALTPDMGPVGNPSDVADLQDAVGSISFYTVRAGDTASSVATLFNITKGTLLSANGLQSGQALKPGQVLVILPVSGTQYLVKAGDTIAGIVKKNKIEQQGDFLFYNNLTTDADLIAGDTLIIPDSNFDGTADTVAVKKTTKVSTKTKAGTVDLRNDPNAAPINVHPIHLYSKPDLGNAIHRPVAAALSTISQMAHGFNGDAVDIAAHDGTPVMAALDGTVLLARDVGYNDGYGEYVIIMSNVGGFPVETIYAHQQQLYVHAGMQVSQGQMIGRVGHSGHATGPHLHFEVRGGLNPWTLEKNRYSDIPQ